jgi:undecaprenyl-diphosphatase
MDWELKFMEWANGWWRSPVLDAVLPWLTHLGSHVAVWVFILAAWIRTKNRKFLRHLFLLYAIQSIILYSLKFLIHRQRPPFALQMDARFAGGPGEMIDPSFPSAHTLCAFMMATLLSAWFPKFRIVFYLLAAFIGWTRIYLGMHYPTDVIAGALLGYGITKLFHLWSDSLKYPSSKRTEHT